MSRVNSLSQQFEEAMRRDLGAKAKDGFLWLCAAVQVHGEPTPQIVAWVMGRFRPPSDDIGQRFYIADRQDGQWMWQRVGPAVTLVFPQMLQSGWSVVGD